MFKKISLFILMIITSLLLSSCFEVAVEITLDKDGSGILKQRVLFSEMMIAQMTDIAQSFGDGEEKSGAESLYDEEKLKKEAASFGEGVEFLSGSEITENGKTGYEALYLFSDIRKLKINSDPSSAIEDGSAQGTDKAEDEYFNFDFIQNNDLSKLTVVMNNTDSEDPEADISNEEADMPGEERSDVSDLRENNTDSSEVDEAAMEIMKQFFSGMRFSYKVNFNGTITDTDALYVDNSTVTLIEIDFDKLMENPEAFAELENLQEGNPSETIKAMKDLEGIKAEMKDLITVAFE